MEILDRPRAFWAHIHPLWRFLIAILVVAGLGVLAGRPALGLYRNWKSAQTLAEAKEAFASHRFPEARDLAIEVLRRDFQQEQALPILLRSAQKLNDPRRGQVGFSIIQSDSFSPEIRIEAWAVICETAPTYVLRHFWLALDESESKQVAFALPMVDRLLRDQATRAAAELVATFPAPRPAELERSLLEMLAISGSDRSYNELQRQLMRLLKARPSEFAHWISIVDEIPQSLLFPSLYAAVTAAGYPGPDPDLENSLRLARLLIADELDQADALFETTFARHRTRNSIPLIRWCLQNERPQAAAECLDLKSPSDQAALYDLQCQVLLALDDSEMLATFLDSPPASASHWQVHCQRSSLAASLNDPDARQQAEDDALQAAMQHSDRGVLIELAHEAQKRKLSGLFMEAWTEALRRGDGPIPLGDSLKPVILHLAAEHREDDLLTALTTLHHLEPGNPSLLLQHHYLACITGVLKPTTVIADLQPFNENAPANALPLHCTLALAHLLADQPEQADALTSDPQIDWFAVTPSYRAIRAITLAAIDQPLEAAVFFEDFPWNDLLPSEKRVLKGLYKAQLNELSQRE